MKDKSKYVALGAIGLAGAAVWANPKARAWIDSFIKTKIKQSANSTPVTATEQLDACAKPIASESLDVTTVDARSGSAEDPINPGTESGNPSAMYNEHAGNEAQKQAAIIETMGSTTASGLAAGVAIGGPIGAAIGLAGGALIGGFASLAIALGTDTSTLQQPESAQMFGLPYRADTTTTHPGNAIIINVPGRTAGTTNQLAYNWEQLRKVFPDGSCDGSTAIEACIRSKMFSWRPYDSIPTPIRSAIATDLPYLKTYFHDPLWWNSGNTSWSADTRLGIGPTGVINAIRLLRRMQYCIADERHFGQFNEFFEAVVHDHRHANCGQIISFESWAKNSFATACGYHIGIQGAVDVGAKFCCVDFEADAGEAILKGILAVVTLGVSLCTDTYVGASGGHFDPAKFDRRNRGHPGAWRTMGISPYQPQMRAGKQDNTIPNFLFEVWLPFQVTQGERQILRSDMFRRNAGMHNNIDVLQALQDSLLAWEPRMQDKQKQELWEKFYPRLATLKNDDMYRDYHV